jgi:hypothetical protein
MTTAWTRSLIVCLIALPAACVFSAGDDDDFDDDDGNGGDSGSASTQGGSSGAGNGGSSQGGSAQSGSGGGGGQAGSEMFPTPVCTEQDDDDACIACLKQQCCDEWRECDDFGCDEEWNAVTVCVSDIYEVEQFATSDDLGMCISDNTADGSMLPQENSYALIACLAEVSDADGGVGTRCGVPCFGTDVFLE